MTEPITWPIMLTAFSVSIGLLAVVWKHVGDKHAEHKSDVADIYRRMLDETNKRHSLELDLAKNYPQTEHMRSIIDSSLEPLKLQMRHLERDFADYKQSAPTIRRDS